MDSPYTVRTVEFGGIIRVPGVEPVPWNSEWLLDEDDGSWEVSYTFGPNAAPLTFAGGPTDEVPVADWLAAMVAAAVAAARDRARQE